MKYANDHRDARDRAILEALGINHTNVVAGTVDVTTEAWTDGARLEYQEVEGINPRAGRQWTTRILTDDELAVVIRALAGMPTPMGGPS